MDSPKSFNDFFKHLKKEEIKERKKVGIFTNEPVSKFNDHEYKSLFKVGKDYMKIGGVERNFRLKTQGPPDNYSTVSGLSKPVMKRVIIKDFLNCGFDEEEEKEKLQKLTSKLQKRLKLIAATHSKLLGSSSMDLDKFKKIIFTHENKKSEARENISPKLKPMAIENRKRRVKKNKLTENEISQKIRRPSIAPEFLNFKASVEVSSLLKGIMRKRSFLLGIRRPSILESTPIDAPYFKKKTTLTPTQALIRSSKGKNNSYENIESLMFPSTSKFNALSMNNDVTSISNAQKRQIPRKKSKSGNIKSEEMEPSSILTKKKISLSMDQTPIYVKKKVKSTPLSHQSSFKLKFEELQGKCLASYKGNRKFLKTMERKIRRTESQYSDIDSKFRNRISLMV